MSADARPQGEGPAADPQGAATPETKAPEGLAAQEATADVPGPETPDDELKRKFREALERKRRNQAEGGGNGRGRDGSKIHGAHGPVGGKRSFRRKSGG
ncbi:hypothetical protein Sme01_51210 [Sphaerisporangium melleum]|uniref:DUF5302 domain-containing protein n=1 Tax=Sphaerisporangium melleum TaxID=321316 RepID=A0A917VGK5_9ACTN|nr:DUF5302 domain-containing protein [Sphaerisporangium melleum]GGK75567.1 hypothetical protein GCM10007964_17970 [Sphaerisporangium melleum]GII72645.1 hypothetical protein Sme01_51210 [Sphaerisporangium melleum]